MKSLIDFLQNSLSKMNGEWVDKHSHYEEGLCSSLGINYSKPSRYWDVPWNQYLLEIKKGTSIWLDVIRYSEQVLKSNNDASKDTITLFLVPIPAKPKVSIKEIIVVKTSDIITKLGLNETLAKTYLELPKSLPRQSNFQASLTLKDIRSISSKIINKV